VAGHDYHLHTGPLAHDEPRQLEPPWSYPAC
jgi:hypothetical protein